MAPESGLGFQPDERGYKPISTGRQVADLKKSVAISNRSFGGAFNADVDRFCGISAGGSAGSPYGTGGLGQACDLPGNNEPPDLQGRRGGSLNDIGWTTLVT